jgi:hypothetical protein
VSNLGQTISRLAFTPDGKAYATHLATGSSAISGDVVEVDPSSGAIVRTLASGLACLGLTRWSTR